MVFQPNPTPGRGSDAERKQMIAEAVRAGGPDFAAASVVVSDWFVDAMNASRPGGSKVLPDWDPKRLGPIASLHEESEKVAGMLDRLIRSRVFAFCGDRLDRSTGPCGWLASCAAVFDLVSGILGDGSTLRDLAQIETTRRFIVDTPHTSTQAAILAGCVLLDFAVAQGMAMAGCCEKGGGSDD